MIDTPAVTAADSTAEMVAIKATRFTRRDMLATGLFCLVLVVPTWAFPWLKLGLVSDAVSFAVAVLGVNLIVGYAGQISLGHGAFVGLGAYTTVILSGDHGWPLLLTVPAAAVLGFALGVLVGLPALRIRGLHLALLTIGLAAAFGPIVKRMQSITGGTNGKGTQASIVAPSWFGTTRQADARWQYLMIAAVAAVVFALARNLVKGRVGRALGAIRENDLSAVTFGVPVSAYKVAVFGASAAVAAVAGSLFMMQHKFASEVTYSTTLSLQLYTAVFIGGIGTIGGSVVGGAVIVAVPYIFERLGFSLDTGLVYGAALVVITLFAPDGVVGQFRRRRR